jgi:Fic family protein
MPDWDADSPELRANLVRALEEVARSAAAREKPNIEAARHWQQATMHGLVVPDSRYSGAFRGEPGLEKIQVKIGSAFGVAAQQVASELKLFEGKLQRLVAELDALIPAGEEPDEDELAAVIDLCAWVHSEWVRIHPFANGNGRTARLWANAIAIRYGLPPFVRLRPRPDLGYGEAGGKAMRGDWKPTARVFRRLLEDFLK